MLIFFLLFPHFFLLAQMRTTTSKAHSPLSSFPLFLLPFLFALPLWLPQADAQPELSDGVRCSADRSIYPCQAYALYQANPSRVPLSKDLASVGDLFGVSRAMIARSSNLTVAESSAPLRQGELLLVPITCGCDRNRSYAPAAYQIVPDDTFYLVSTVTYGNLTAYPAVELVNPTLVPENLDVGVITIFPIFCQCLKNNTVGGKSILGLVTYVLQPADTYASVAASFGTDVATLTAINGPENGTFSVIFVPLFQIPPPLLRTTVPSEAPASPPTDSTPVIEKNENKGVIAGLAAGLAVVGVICVLQFLLLAWCSRRSSRKGEEVGKLGSSARSSKGGGGSQLGRLPSAEDKLIGDISEWLDKYKVFTVEELRRATGGFAKSHLIQGSVYKGTMEDGEMLAVKKMKWNACDELKILQKVNHTNLVKLEGFCIDAKEGTTYLVYEYVVNGSLDTWLYHGDGASDRKLDWRSRLRVALDVANGLQYIHEHTWPRVVHKDIKSSNILLDASFHAKIANFGLARTGLNAVTTHIVGTQGYVAPEYLADGLVTTKMDVFAFGVVLLELVAGREAVNEDGESLWSEAERVFGSGKGEIRVEEGGLLQWMDAALVEQSCPVESVVSVMNVAMACLKRDPSKRPSMVEATYMLSKADEHFSDYSGDHGLSVRGGDVAARQRSPFLSLSSKDDNREEGRGRRRKHREAAVVSSSHVVFSDGPWCCATTSSSVSSVAASPPRPRRAPAVVPQDQADAVLIVESSPSFSPVSSMDASPAAAAAVPPAAAASFSSPYPPYPSSYSKFNSALNAGLLNPMSPPPPPHLDKTRSSPTLFDMMANEQDYNPRPAALPMLPPGRTSAIPAVASTQDRQLLLQDRVAEIIGSCSPGNQLNDAESSDVRLTVSSKDGLTVSLNVHRHILVAHSRFFGAKLSDRWSKQQRSLPHIVEISDCDDVEVYVETLRLMYCKDLRRRLMREDVSKVLGILKVSAAIAFDAGVLSCLEYLEAAPWEEDEEEKVASLLSQLHLESLGAEEVLKRVSLEVAPSAVEDVNGGSGSEEILVRLLQVVLEGKDEKARREMKSLVSKMLRENNTASHSGAAADVSGDLSKESLYSACDGCLRSLRHHFARAAASDLGEAAQIARQADNLHWILDILIDRQIADDFLRTWACQGELSEMHPRVPAIHRYEVSRVTARLFVGVGKGQILVSKEARCLLLRTWLEPFYEDFGWMRRACKGLDRHLIEDGLANTILTLPLATQQEVLLAWFDRFLNAGDDCPNIQRGFEVWWRRAFWRRNGDGDQRPPKLRIAASSACENSC
ncbi:hypothetical protein Cni_G14469 [Canna indica]|uniref:Protein kinase domain-containing protein n=1 Tax=Canna indica TaxID=4628 RepID=A0AAQ3KF15_9LILI|nr:hypothetical protein Cni_G14469 [Canna indica]